MADGRCCRPAHSAVLDTSILFPDGCSVPRSQAIFIPKTGDARDVMMGAPSKITEGQLKDVHVRLAKEAEGKELKGADTVIGD